MFDENAVILQAAFPTEGVFICSLKLGDWKPSLNNFPSTIAEGNPYLENDIGKRFSQRFENVPKGEAMVGCALAGKQMAKAISFQTPGSIPP